MRSHPDWRKGPRGDLSDPLAPLARWLFCSLSIGLCVVVDTKPRTAGSGMAEVSSRWLFLCGVLWRYPAQRSRKIQMLVELPPVPSLSIGLCVVVDMKPRTARSGMAEVSSRWLFLCGVLWRYPAQRSRKIQMLVELPPVPSLSIGLCVVVDMKPRTARSGMAEVSSRWLFLCGVLCCSISACSSYDSSSVRCGCSLG